MNLTLRALVVAATFLAALATAGMSADPAFAADAGLDFWNIPDLWKASEAGDRERDDLERKGQVAARRMSVRAETVQELVAGRVTPEEAVKTFVALNRSDAKTLAWCRSQYAGASDDERAARQLIGHIRSLGTHNAALADATARRLGVPAGP
jgi:hypothetical protein